MAIHDRSYTRWDGNRDAAVKAVPIIAAASIQQGLRGFFRWRVPAVLLTLWSYALFLFGLVIIILRHYVLSNADTASPGLVEFVGNEEILEFTTPSGSTIHLYLGMQAMWALIICVIMGSGLIANDRRTNALELYLSRPVSVLQYFLGKFFAVAFFVSLVTMIPALILVVTQLAVSFGDAGELTRLLDVMWRTIAAGAVVVTLPSLLVLAMSSMAERARNAAIMLLGLPVLLDIVLASMLVSIFGNQHLLLFSILFNVNQVIGAIFGSEQFGFTAEVPIWQSAAVLGFWVLLCLRIIFKRVRPVEIVG